MSQEKQTQTKRGIVKEGRAGPGRKKGVPNKTTTQLKDMIINALDRAGGTEYLYQCAQNPKLASAFLTLVGKVLPVTLQGDKENPLHVTTINRVIVEPPKK